MTGVYIERPELVDLYDPMSDLPPLECSECGYVGCQDSFDCLGLENGELECGQCGTILTRG